MQSHRFQATPPVDRKLRPTPFTPSPRPPIPLQPGLGVLRPALLLGGMLPAALLAAAPPYPLSVDNQRTARGYRLQARNLGPAPVSLSLSLSDSRNLASERSFPQLVVVPPNGGSVDFGEVYAAHPGHAFSFRTQYRWLLGDFHARHATETLYRLPWLDGQQFTLGQAPGGPISTHTRPDSEYAVDIPMPEGTPIVAARGGRVIATEAGESDGRQTADMLSRANLVKILHEDRSIGVYAHLAPGGVRVSSGQYVAAGQVIGLAGSTGYSSGPHLHFAVLGVRRNGEQLESVSLPFNFHVGNPPQVIVPRYGLTLTAQYQHPYQPAVPAPAAAGTPPKPPENPATAARQPQLRSERDHAETWVTQLAALPASVWAGLLVALSLLFAWFNHRNDRR
ncbi:M23 family metallopeptidase [Dechloromonas sp. ZY10]|uniref:M23 family metallopeptidase n=1 Tax=Dechloromonas aquae TaxID=2664436 RepID=UPI003529BC36